jgi:hypothetical protein
MEGWVSPKTTMPWMTSSPPDESVERLLHAGSGDPPSPNGCRGFEACQRGKWSPWTGLTLGLSCDHRCQVRASVVLAGRALCVP